MLEARVVKATVVHRPGRSGLKTVLVGVAEYLDQLINFKVEYDWQTLDRDWFVQQLRDQLAQGFDVPVYRVDIREKMLFDKMQAGSLTL